MFIKAIVLEVALLCVFIFLILRFLNEFGVNGRRALVFVFPLVSFAIGFYLRLVGSKELIDLGYFLTEFSTIFVTIIFTVCLYLGQVKYWGTSRK